MQFINHIIEPTRLLVTWQSADERERTRYIIAELLRDGDEITLRYLKDSPDFAKASSLGFDLYPAFRNADEVYNSGVLEAFMRRLPPRSRGDYPQYLEGFRIRPDTDISNFALLGYTGARLPSDGFAIVNPFDNVNTAFEFLLEPAGYRYYKNSCTINLDETASFKKEFDSNRKEDVIKIFIGENFIGYVTRALLPSFENWLNHSRVESAWIEKMNGTPEQPLVYLYMKISGLKFV
jgi:hypothetical protein